MIPLFDSIAHKCEKSSTFFIIGLTGCKRHFAGIPGEREEQEKEIDPYSDELQDQSHQSFYLAIP